MKHVSKEFRQSLVRVARCHLFQHYTDGDDLRAGLAVMIVGRMVGLEHFQDIPDLNQFIAQNRAVIDPLVNEAIERGLKAGPL